MHEDNGLEAWEKNAVFWDHFMGDESNEFHREIVRPVTEKLLNIQMGDRVLDIACGNGNFSERLVEKGASVVAFDFSKKMIQLARRRRARVLGKVVFSVCDATDYGGIMGLAMGKPFDKAVANMAVMDIADIKPLLAAVHDLLKDGGRFVFSLHHPCFTYPDGNYFESCTHLGEAISGQPALQNYYHRSLQELFNTAFEAGFSIDGYHELPFLDPKLPAIIVVRISKSGARN